MELFSHTCSVNRQTACSNVGTQLSLNSLKIIGSWKTAWYIELRSCLPLRPLGLLQRGHIVMSMRWSLRRVSISPVLRSLGEDLACLVWRSPFCMRGQHGWLDSSAPSMPDIQQSFVKVPPSPTGTAVGGRCTSSVLESIVGCFTSTSAFPFPISHLEFWDL